MPIILGAVPPIGEETDADFRGNIVSDTGALIRLYDHHLPGNGPTEITLARRARVRIMVLPVADPQRGTVERGGHLYGSTAWLDGETISLFDASGHELARFQAARDPISSRRQVHDAPSATFVLQPGAYTLRPSTPFSGNYSLTVIEE